MSEKKFANFHSSFKEVICNANCMINERMNHFVEFLIPFFSRVNA